LGDPNVKTEIRWQGKTAMALIDNFGRIAATVREIDPPLRDVYAEMVREQASRQQSPREDRVNRRGGDSP